MTAIVAVETVLLVLLVVLVAGLLRSHAEILRRLGEPGGEPAGRRPAPRAEVARGPAPRAEAARGPAPRAEAAGGPAPSVGREQTTPPPRPTPRTGAQLLPAPLTGATPHGDAIALAFDGAASRPTLLAFLTSGCSTCAAFWDTLAEPRLPRAVQIVIVTHGAQRERPTRLRELAPAAIPVVMSSQAWEDYGVPGAPYFVLVDGVVRGEGVATTWQALASLVSDAIEDQHESELADPDPDADPNADANANPDADAGTRRARRIDQTLAAAGIGPDHPSLYPGREAR